jgi:L-aspartate oxidase
MGHNVAVERSGERLAETREIMEFWGRYVMDKVFDQPSGWEVQNMLTVALAIARCAELRSESRGVHWRTDFPRTDTNWRTHTSARLTPDGLGVTREALPQATGAYYS